MTTETDLTLIPRSVRDKLDRVGIKLHLRQWELLPLAERRELVEAPCGDAAEADAYRDRLTALIRRHTGGEPDRQ